jgi:predicted GH43/DUF377 family glycosyl hydrolase
MKRAARNTVSRGRGWRAAAIAGLSVCIAACGGGGSSNAAAPATAQQPAAPVAEGAQIVPTQPVVYSDGRVSTSLRLPATDYGIVLPYGTAPDGADAVGARDVFVYQAGSTYYMTYDGAPQTGSWNTVLASSTDLTAWTVHGNIMPLGNVGDPDSNCVCYGTTYFDGSLYHMYYTTSTSGSTSPPVPYPNYQTMSASAPTPQGPWAKGGALTFDASANGKDGITPGQLVTYNGQYLQFVSTGTKQANESWARTIGIARAASPSGPWTLDTAPALPPSEQLENAVVWYQQSTGTWFLFANHVGIKNGIEIDDADWVYWSQDPTHWDTANKAVVMDSTASSWSKNVIGIPSVIQIGDRLALLYDGDRSPAQRTGLEGNLNRDVGLAWIQLPIKAPS